MDESWRVGRPVLDQRTGRGLAEDGTPARQGPVFD